MGVFFLAELSQVSPPWDVGDQEIWKQGPPIIFMPFLPQAQKPL